MRDWHTDARRKPLSDARIEAISAEVEREMMAAEDAAFREKMAGLRCMSCECPLPPPSPGSRECGPCASRWKR